MTEPVTQLHALGTKTDVRVRRALPREAPGVGAVELAIIERQGVARRRRVAFLHRATAVAVAEALLRAAGYEYALADKQAGETLGFEC